MSTRTLGFIGIICSPFLAILLNTYGIFENYKATSLGGMFSLVYMTGWLCSIAGLYRLRAAGNKKIGKIILTIQVIFLLLGEIWNVYSIIDPGSPATIYWVLDMFWPLSNIFMFVTGLSILLAKQLNGWRRYIPFAVGLWFPVTVVITPMIFGTGNTTLMITSIYSASAWSLLGLTVYASAKEKMKDTGKMYFANA